jgi:hypothetical protein
MQPDQNDLVHHTIAPGPPEPTPPKKSRRGLIIVGGVIGLCLLGGAIAGLTSGKSTDTTKAVAPNTSASTPTPTTHAPAPNRTSADRAYLNDIDLLTDLRSGVPAGKADQNDGLLIQLGHTVCDQFTAGTSVNDLRTTLTSGSNAWSTSDANGVIDAATAAYCPNVKPATGSAPTSSAPKPKPKPTQHYTVAQENAIGSAKDYLATMAFSRAGLIEQLSSSSGEGYSKADATFAVDHLHVDWNQQAVRSAREYLSTQHFSRAGLIEQLSSSSGEGFTVAQATYAADHVGL